MNRTLSAKVHFLGHFISKIPFVPRLIRRYHLWGVNYLHKLLPFSVSSIYLKGGLLRDDWNFAISDVDLVLVLPHRSLDLLEEQKQLLSTCLPRLRLLCPCLHDCDLILQKHFHLASKQKAFYRRDVHRWMRVHGLELRDAHLLSPLSLSFYEQLEILYFYILWFCRKRQMIRLNSSPREILSLNHLILKWREHFSLPPVDELCTDQALSKLVDLSEQRILQQLNSEGMGAFVERLMAQETLIPCHSSFAHYYCDFSQFERAPIDGVLPVFLGHQLYSVMSHLGIIRLWELYQLSLNEQALIPKEVRNHLSQKLLWRSIEWWKDWGRDNFKDKIEEL